MSVNDDAEALLHRPGETRPTWTALGFPAMEGQPTITPFMGTPYQVPEFPPLPGKRICDGRVA